jgi:hypothetical protein
MRAVRVRTACLVIGSLVLGFAGPAAANGPAHSDPSANYVVGKLPEVCSGAPTSARCTNAAVSYLDQARASLGLGPYDLPADFVSLSPDEQAFILTNLDRTAYGLAAVPGLTAELNGDAEFGVQSDSDPSSTDADFGDYSGNWAGGYTNMAVAYEAWVYDDGPGSTNLDCTASNPSGCWGHRHTVLDSFDGSGMLAMGAAAGTDRAGADGYAMLLGEGDTRYAPAYTYTWAQAQRDGAGTNSYRADPPQVAAPVATKVIGPASSPPKPKPKPTHSRPSLRITGIRLLRQTLRIQIAARKHAQLRCAFSPRLRSHWVRDRYSTCRPTAIYTGVFRGRWRFRVRAGPDLLTLYVRVV